MNFYWTFAPDVGLAQCEDAGPVAHVLGAVIHGPSPGEAALKEVSGRARPRDVPVMSVPLIQSSLAFPVVGNDPLGSLRRVAKEGRCRSSPVINAAEDHILVSL